MDQSVEKSEPGELLKTTDYERASSFLISLLILSTSSVVVLVLLWLAYRPPPSSSVERVHLAGGGETEELNGGGDLETPTMEELAGMPVVDAISSLRAFVGEEAIQSASQLELGGAKDPAGAGAGKDLSRPVGPPEQVPRWDRWEIRYSARSVDAYARQLDFFGIELGAVGGKPTIDYARRFTSATPLTRSGTGSDETRLYMTWRRGRLKQWDRTLLKTAGVDVGGRIVMQFYPERLEQTLAKLEAEHANGKTVDQIRKTVFELKPKSDEYELVVVAQRFQ